MTSRYISERNSYMEIFKIKIRFIPPHYLKRYVIVLLGFAAIFQGCRKEDELIIDSSIPAEIRSVNNYIFNNMNSYYLWADNIPGGLNPNVEPDPVKFFDKLLYKTDDRWSYITEDYQALVNSFQGVHKSFGYQFRLFKQPSGDKVFGIVEYVIPGSPADNAGIKRGDIFNSINETGLTTTNYSNLLFGVDSYKVGFAEMVNGELITNGITRDITAITLQQNPIFLTKIFEEGGEKIGYLVYLQFISNYEDSLRNVFLAFKAAGINDLILDFRYNPGGSVNTARIMAKA